VVLAERGRQLDLSAKSTEELVIAGNVAAKNLEGRLPGRGNLFAKVYSTQTACAEAVEDPIPPVDDLAEPGRAAPRFKAPTGGGLLADADPVGPSALYAGLRCHRYHLRITNPQ
jgi:hypothetical protein